MEGRHGFKHLSNLPSVAVHHTYQHMAHGGGGGGGGLLLLLTEPMYTTLSITQISASHTTPYCYRLLQGLGYSCTGELNQQNSRCKVENQLLLAIRGNTCPVVRTPHSKQQNQVPAIPSACRTSQHLWS